MAASAADQSTLANLSRVSTASPPDMVNKSRLDIRDTRGVQSTSDNNDTQELSIGVSSRTFQDSDARNNALNDEERPVFMNRRKEYPNISQSK